MKRVRRLSMRTAMPFLACCLAAALVSVARAGDKAQLSGHWNFNPDQSDDAQQKVQEAQQNSANARRGGGGGYPGNPGGGTYPGGGGIYPGGGYPGGGYPVGGSIGRGGLGGPMGGPMGGGIGRRGGMGNPSRGISSQEWEELAANPRHLSIHQHDDQVVISDDSNHTRTLYPDGKKHEEKDANGKKISTKTEWQGDALTAETRLGHSGKLTETYRLSPDGKQLFVVSRFDDSSLSGPLSIRRVYDLGNVTTR
jgi:hypothetical protein